MSRLTWRALTGTGAEVELEEYADGPMLVRHADVVVDQAGDRHEVTRPVVALCTCEKSQRLPWCDSTHKAIRRR